MVNSAREVYGSVKAARKMPKTEWWGDDVKTGVEGCVRIGG